MLNQQMGLYVRTFNTFRSAMDTAIQTLFVRVPQVSVTISSGNSRTQTPQDTVEILPLLLLISRLHLVLTSKDVRKWVDWFVSCNACHSTLPCKLPQLIGSSYALLPLPLLPKILIQNFWRSSCSHLKDMRIWICGRDVWHGSDDLMLDCGLSCFLLWLSVEIGGQPPPKPDEPSMFQQPQLLIKRPPEGQKLMKPPEVGYIQRLDFAHLLPSGHWWVTLFPFGNPLLLLWTTVIQRSISIAWMIRYNIISYRVWSASLSCLIGIHSFNQAAVLNWWFPPHPIYDGEIWGLVCLKG